MMPAKADTMICMNFKYPWLCVREALPLLQRTAAAGDPARIVIVGSIGGLRPNAGMYSATRLLAQILAVKLAPLGVTVNVVAQGT
jgi:NAD(P)-dependent dehydrogenase (short-subunit alcohol dehydrogenase family)